MTMRFSTVSDYSIRLYCISSLVAVLFMALLPTSARAQDQQAAAPWFNVTVVHVKPGHTADFEDRVKGIAAASAKAKRPPIEIYEVVRGDQGTYHIVAPVQKLAENDNPLPPPMGPGEMANFINRLLPTIDSSRNFIARNYVQDQITGDGDAQAKLLLFRSVRVVAQRGDDFVKWVESDLLPNLKKAKMSFTFAQGSFGDSAQNFYVAEPVADWAALDKPSPIEAMLGAKGMKQLTDKLKGIVEYSELTLFRPRPDLANPTQ
jgi:hypothetical protein